MNKKTILCVDDEPSILNSLRRLLRKENYTLLMANGGQEGLSVLEKHPVHLVISDQRMPEMTGIEFLRQVKEQFPETIRVVLSGYADVHVIVDAINEGEVYRFLTKPWNDGELKTAIRQCLEHYEILEQNRWLLEQSRAQNRELQRLNNSLETVVQERTRSLRLSQDILENLPIPVIGVGRERIVVSANRIARELFPASQRIGENVGEVFPAQIAEWVTPHLTGEAKSDVRTCEWDGYRICMRVEPLRDGDTVRGCVLVPEVISG